MANFLLDYLVHQFMLVQVGYAFIKYQVYATATSFL